MSRQALQRPGLPWHKYDDPDHRDELEAIREQLYVYAAMFDLWLDVTEAAAALRLSVDELRDALEYLKRHGIAKNKIASKPDLWLLNSRRRRWKIPVPKTPTLRAIELEAKRAEAIEKYRERIYKYGQLSGRYHPEHLDYFSDFYQNWRFDEWAERQLANFAAGRRCWRYPRGKGLMQPGGRRR
jgi:hypothetical protein